MKTRLLAALLLLCCLPFSVQAYVLGPTTPGKWGSPTLGTGATVNWSYMSTGTDCSAEYAGCLITAFADFMPTGYLTTVQSAFNAWSAVANLTFNQVADATGVDIRLGGHYFDGAGNVLAHGYYPPNNGSLAGDIHFDTGDTWKIGFGGSGFDLFNVLTHELGHALGLAHSTDINALMYPYYTESFSGPQADDIAGMQYLYGAAVPLPGTLALLLIGFGFLRTRRSANAA